MLFVNKGYKLIDTEKWPRTEYFRHFMDEAPCSISMCDEIDVTRLKTACHTLKISFYIAFLYVVSEIVNSHDELKMLAVDTPDLPYPLPAVWDRVEVAHNVFHDDTETYTSTFTVWKEDFREFYENCTEDVARAKSVKYMSIPSPDNIFEASCVPWRHFTSVGVMSDNVSLYPIIAWGGFVGRDGKTYMPLSISIHHAAADGFHIARFINEAEEKAKNLAEELLRAAAVCTEA